MTRLFNLVVLSLLSGLVNAQTEKLNDFPKKGSYLYYPQPAFEDNSFLLEEAITQEKNIMQYISNFYFDNIKGGDFIYSFTQEIPITHLKHQISYTLYYNVLHQKTGRSNGLGDITIGYHYMLSDKKAWAMVVPGFNLILPTGKASSLNGAGGLGGQATLAVTKRISQRLITHYNVGYTYISKADRYTSVANGSNVLSYERDLQHVNAGASVIWYQTRKFNWMIEYVSNFVSEIRADGSLTHTNHTTFNPGFRFAIDHKLVQIVPGVSAPVMLTDGKYDRVGLFFYLSFEPEYLPFYKPKGR